MIQQFELSAPFYLFIFIFLPHNTACGILVSWLGIKPVPKCPLHWKYGILTSGPPGKSLPAH